MKFSTLVTEAGNSKDGSYVVEELGKTEMEAFQPLKRGKAANNWKKKLHCFRFIFISCNPCGCDPTSFAEHVCSAWKIQWQLTHDHTFTTSRSIRASRPFQIKKQGLLSTISFPPSSNDSRNKAVCLSEQEIALARKSTFIYKASGKDRL